MLLDSIDTTLRDPLEASRFLGVDVIGTMPIDRSGGSAPKPIVPAAERGRPRNRRPQAPIARDTTALPPTLKRPFARFATPFCCLTLRAAPLNRPHQRHPFRRQDDYRRPSRLANADRGKKTLLVDADLRRPSLHSKFGINPREGLSNVLTGEMAWQDVVLPIEGKPNLTLLPAGPGSHRAADLIGPRLSSLLDEFAKDYDLVILDSPAVAWLCRVPPDRLCRRWRAHRQPGRRNQAQSRCRGGLSAEKAPRQYHRTGSEPGGPEHLLRRLFLLRI